MHAGRDGMARRVVAGAVPATVRRAVLLNNSAVAGHSIASDQSWNRRDPAPHQMTVKDCGWSPPLHVSDRLPSRRAHTTNQGS